ncbi:MAG TPA: DUF1146 domain-containing protein [Bacilli bacterium]|nr:DUF1146 domain-containing protein [Bacilli bacterium]
MYFGNGDTGVGWMALLNLCFLLFGVLIAWFALTNVRWEVFLKAAKTRQAAVLRLLVAVALGYLLARFLSDYVTSTMMMRQLF